MKLTAIEVVGRMILGKKTFETMFWLLIREVLLVVSVLAKNCQGSKAAKTISA
jgi:hypothetical protein